VINLLLASSSDVQFGGIIDMNTSMLKFTVSVVTKSKYIS
jgi:hypothetical protein